MVESGCPVLGCGSWKARVLVLDGWEPQAELPHRQKDAEAHTPVPVELREELGTGVLTAASSAAHLRPVMSQVHYRLFRGCKQPILRKVCMF